MSWSRAFDDPIELPDGRSLTTLRQAGNYIASLTEKEQQKPEWQTAAEMLLLAVEGKGPMMFAQIGLLKALHAHKPAAARRKRTAKKYRLIR